MPGSDLRVGSVCSGVGGLDRGVQAVFPGSRLVWVADNQPGPAAVLAARFPGVLNLGDITTVDWARTPPVDVICGSTPCTDLSCAGRREGLTGENRSSGPWWAMLAAVEFHRPAWVVWENVEGSLSAPAVSDVEPCPIHLGDPDDVHLRALGAVVGSLSEVGYDCCWETVPATCVGAPHRRRRVFLLAWPSLVADPGGVGFSWAGRARDGWG